MRQVQIPPKFKVGQTVKLPGRQFRSTGYGYANKFMWDQTGIIEKTGWSKPSISQVKIPGSRREAANQYGYTYITYDYETIEISYPMYLIDGRWYGQNEIKKN